MMQIIFHCGQFFRLSGCKECPEFSQSEIDREDCITVSLSIFLSRIALTQCLSSYII